jgi:cytochrome d ubiquinol oxidase subunit I
VLFTLLGFLALYTVLIVVEMKLMLGAIRKGPQDDPAPSPAADVPLAGKVRAA